MSCSESSSSTTDALCSPPALYNSESRGSSVSTDMREEYEDLLRFAVVMPVEFDAKKALTPGSRTRAEQIRSTPQPQPVHVSKHSLRPEVRIVDLEDSDDSSTVCSQSQIHLAQVHPAPTLSRPAADLNQSLSLQASLEAHPPFKPSAPYTAMNVQAETLGAGTGLQDKVQHPGHNLQLPGHNVQHQGHNVQHPGHDLQHPGHDLQHPGHNVQHPAYNFQHPGHNVQHPGHNVQHPGHDVQHLGHNVPLQRDLNLAWSRDAGVGEGEDSESSIKVQAQLVDPEITRLGNQMDVWCQDLKRNIMAEFEQSRLRLIECQLAQFRDEREKRASELKQAREELERFKELLVTYEQSITRKDHIIANLTRSMQKQKERIDLQRTFDSWKLRHLDEKRELFTSVMARKHYNCYLQRLAWEAWFGIIRRRWKNKVERACQLKAEEVCMQLTDQYEEKLASVHQCLEDSRKEVVELQAQRDLYEENMKKAFMRGVCALNLEAMTMFKYNDDTASTNGEPEPPPPTVTFLAEGTEAQKAKLSAHMQRTQNTPTTMTDMRPLKATECLTVPAKSVHVCASTALDRNGTNTALGPMATAMLPSRVHHQHVLNKHGVEEGQYPGDGGISGRGGPSKPCTRCVRGGTKPPAVFVQRHSEKQ